MERIVVAEEKKPQLGALRILGGYLKPHWGKLLCVAVALLVSASSVVSMGWGLKVMIDEGFTKQNVVMLKFALLYLMGITVLLSIATFFRHSLIVKVGENVVAEIRRHVFKKLVKLSPGYFEDTRTGELISRLGTDTTVLQVVVGSSLPIAVRNIMQLTGGVIMVFITSPKLTAYVSVIAPVVALMVVTMSKRMRKLARVAQDKVADMSSHLDEVMRGIMVVQAYGMESFEFQNFTRLTNIARDSAVARVKARAKLSSTVIFLVFGSIVLVMFVGGQEVLKGNITTGELSSFVFYSMLVASAMGALGDVAGDLYRAAGATERLVELIRSEPDIKSPDSPVPLPEKVRGTVTFESVNFRYPSKPDTDALRDVSFKAEAGKLVALVGPSGAGKSTILKLILRFYDPQAGRVLFDGIDVRELSLKDFRSQIAYVSQESVIFSSNLWDNIRFGMEEATNEQVIEAAKAAHAWNFIEKLPHKMDTFVGERGMRLSGGERQRIALARAILRKPKLLLLDEATNALDAENEKLVREALEVLIKDCTTIVIAHRLATVLEADNIIVMNDGGIEAMGTHKELVKQGTLYARLAELQFQELNAGKDK